MAARITLPGAGAIDLDFQEARALNVGLLEVDADYDQDDVNNSAAPRSYIDRGDIRFYDATATYGAGEYVLFDNRIWFAVRQVTGVEPSSTATDDWTELSRQNLFLRFSDGTNEFEADAVNDTVTFNGGTNITTTANTMTDALTIDWAAMLNDLSNVDAASPTTGYYLQYDGTNWVPAEVSGSGFTSVTNGTTTVDTTPAIQTIQITGEDASVNVGLASDTDSANFTIGVTTATTSQRGLLSAADKTLIDDVRDGGYANSELNLNLDSFVLRLSDGASAITSADLSSLEDIGGKAWNPTTTYVTGDIVSRLVSGNYFTYFATQGSLNQPPETMNSMFWQQADVLRVRDIENIDLPDTLADNSLLIWSQPDPNVDGEWVATNAALVVGMVGDLLRDADIETDSTGQITGIVQDNNTTATPIKRQLERWQPNTAYLVGDTFYTDNDTVLFRTENRDHTYYVHTALDDTHATFDLVTRNSVTPLDVADPDIPPAGGRGITVNGPISPFGLPVYEINFTPQFQTGFAYQVGDVFTTTGDTTFYPPGFINVVCFVTTAIDTSHFTFSQTVQDSVRVLDDPYRGAWSTLESYVEGDIVQYTVANPSTAPVADRLHFYIASASTTATTSGATPNPNPEESPNWQRLTTRFGTGLTDTDGTVSITNPYNPNRATPDWSDTVTYSENDIVLYVDEGGTPSYYRSRTDNNLNNEPVDSSGDQDFTNWRLINAGLVSIRTNGNNDAGAGITANSTLHINEGSGIQVDRNQTTFTISAHGTGHSDASQFAPGYRYSYYPLYGEVGLLTGVVTSTSFNQTIRFLRDDGANRVRIQWTSGLTGAAGADYGFVIQGRTNDPSSILNSDEDHIFYGFSSPTDNELFFITQADPTVADVDALNSLLGIVPPNQLSPNLNVEVFLLENDHPNPQYEPAVWAREGNTDDLNVFRGTNRAGNPITTDTEGFTLTGDNLDLNLTQHVSSETVNVFDDVNLTRPTDETQDGPNQVIHWDGTNSDWINTEANANSLTDVNLTRPTDETMDGRVQGVMWDASGSEWVNADIVSSRFRFSGTDATSNDVEITGYITDNDTATGTPTTVRSADFNGTGGRLRFELARFMTTTGLTGGGNLNWDVPAGDFTMTATLDDLVQETWIADVSGMVTGGTDSATFAALRGTSDQELPITTRAALNATFDVSLTNPIYDLGNPNTASVNVNYLDNEGTQRGLPQTITYRWATPTIAVNITDPARVSFLQTIASVPYSITTTGVTDRSVAASGVAGTGGDVTATSVTGNATGTLTFTDAAHKDNTSTERRVTVTTVFTRPAGVQSAAGGETRNSNSSDIPNFTFGYPVFYILRSGTTAPDLGDIINGNAFDSAVTVLPGPTGNGSASSFGIRQITSLSVDATLWVGFRTSIAQPTNFRIGTDSFRGDITPTPTGQTIMLQPDTVPTGYNAESYTMYPIGVLANANPFIEIS